MPRCASRVASPCAQRGRVTSASPAGAPAAAAERASIRGGVGVGVTRLLRPITVTDADDPAVADFLRLTDAGLRRSREGAAGLFIAEGALVVRRAVRAGYRLRSLLLLPDQL